MNQENIVFIARSLDGYIAGKNGELDWLSMIPNPDHQDMGFTTVMDRVDALVMGKNTFEVICSFDVPWPYSKPVYVISTTLTEIPEKYQDKAELVKGTIPEVLSQLHQKGCHKLYIDGGAVVQSFLKEDLIDELIITTIPILLGNGIPLFGHLPQSLAFDHVKSEVFLEQIVQNTYRRKRE